jgi:adenylate cyclase
MNLPPGVRLACQFRPEQDVSVTPILSPATAHLALLQGAQLGVEREIAVMFCDLRGFTEISEHRLPYDVVFLLNRYFAAMGEAIASSGGHIDKFIGDGIMALFGMKCDPANGSRQALAAAARMSARVDQLNAGFTHELPQKLRIGIGIHSGTVVLGEMGWGTARGLTAIGDCVNTASRLENLSKDFGAELVVSEDVERNSGLDLSPWPSHEVTIRGRSTPLNIRSFERARELTNAVALRDEAA